MTRIPRADAAHNRQHIVTIARAAFTDDGLELPIREIAHRAGLGPATVYRHFPTRADLLTEVLAEHVAACRADMRAALADPDAWRALSGIIRRFAEHQVKDRNLNEALFGSRTVAATFTQDRREHANALDTLVERARRAGAIRAEVTAADVRVGLTALASFGTLRPERAAPAALSLVNLLLAGMSA